MEITALGHTGGLIGGSILFFVYKFKKRQIRKNK
jgi:hypothetical protein